MESSPSGTVHFNGCLCEAAIALHETHSTQPSRPESSATPPEYPRTKTVLVVFQRPQKRFYLVPMTVMTLETGEDVMRRLRAAWKQEVSKIKPLKLIRLLLWQPVIEIAALSTVSDLLELTIREH
jgi:hypothetical protein